MLVTTELDMLFPLLSFTPNILVFLQNIIQRAITKLLRNYFFVHELFELNEF